MMSKLTRLRDEADRLLTVYTIYKDCPDADMRRRAHVQLDRFLMENRETAALLMLQGLVEEVQKMQAELELEYEQPVKKSRLRAIISRLTLRRSHALNKSSATSHSASDV